MDSGFRGPGAGCQDDVGQSGGRDDDRQATITITGYSIASVLFALTICSGRNLTGKRYMPGGPFHYRWTMRKAVERVIDAIRGRPESRATGFCVQLEKPGIFLGSSYGGWTVCPEGLHKGSVAYSFGIGKDITFDIELIDRFGMTVHAFDPTPESLDWLRGQNLPPQFVPHAYGLAARDGTVMFHPPQNPEHVSHSMVHRGRPGAQPVEVPVHRLGTIMGMLGHTGIDLLKMDIEGAEYESLNDILKTGNRVPQILVEFHHRFPGIGVKSTRSAIEALNAAGYAIFSISGSYEEFSFIRNENIS